MEVTLIVVLKNLFQQSQVMLFEDVTEVSFLEGQRLYGSFHINMSFYRINPYISSAPLQQHRA